MKKFLFAPFAILFLSALVFAQPRPLDKSGQTDATGPTSYEARYEGGTFGAHGREKGSLEFDDANEMVIFRRKDGRKMFEIPYEDLLVIYPDSKVSVSQTGDVVSRLPLPGAGMAGLLSNRAQYLVINFDDPEIQTQGTANFKIEHKEDLLKFIDALGTRAKMKQRGDAYYRGRNKSVY